MGEVPSQTQAEGEEEGVSNNARLVADLPFGISSDGFDVASETLNMSKSGILIRIRKEIPLMKKVELMLGLLNKQGQCIQLKVKGVVVHSEKEAEGTFKTAVFYTDMD